MLNGCWASPVIQRQTENLKNQVRLLEQPPYFVNIFWVFGVPGSIPGPATIDLFRLMRYNNIIYTNSNSTDGYMKVKASSVTS